MQRWRGFESVPEGWGRSVVTIGVFDGVHRGHQMIIGHAVKRAHDMGLPSVVVTFDPHPAEVVRPGSHPAVLTEPARKAELIEQLGADALCVVPARFRRRENLGAESILHFDLVATPSTPVLCRVGHAVPEAPPEGEVLLGFAPQDCHVFDAQGQRLAVEPARRAPGPTGLELLRAGEAR